MSIERESMVDINRIERYRLLLRARIVTRGHAVTGCLLHPVTLSEPVTVTYSDAKSKANLRNVQTCKSVWCCPVCADRITKVRAAELMSGLESWSKQGNSVSMATYTISHQTYESCEEVLTRLMAAYNRFKSGKGYQSLKFLHGVAGSVRALEVLHGRNGWHWHLHEIFLLQGMAKIRHKSMLATMSKRWMDVVSKSGGHAVEKGFDLKHESQSAFDYIVKFGKTGQSETWNVAREVVRAPAKQRRTEISGHHPFALLENSERRRADAVAWNEYVQATKGKQQLRYSVGAKQLLGMIDVTDDEIIDAESAAEDRVMVSIPSRGWYLLNMRATSVIVEFWQVANTGDSELLFAWLDNQDIDDVQRVA